MQLAVKMKEYKIPLRSLLLLLGLSTFSYQVKGQVSVFSKEVYENVNGEKLNYRQMMSDYAPDIKYPLVIFLHGSGERGSDNKAQLKWGVQNFASDEVMKLYQPIVIAPQCPENTSWANMNWESETMMEKPTKTMALLIELIEQKIMELPVDKDRVYITGLSMGGFGTFEIMMRRPDLFAAAVPVCGGGDVSKASQIARIPMWIFHGADDGAVAAVLSRNMVMALHKAGAKPGYTQYPEVGHFSWVAAYSDPMMMAWLFRQRK